MCQDCELAWSTTQISTVMILEALYSGTIKWFDGIRSSKRLREAISFMKHTAHRQNRYASRTKGTSVSMQTTQRLAKGLNFVALVMIHSPINITGICLVKTALYLQIALKGSAHKDGILSHETVRRVLHQRHRRRRQCASL